MAKFGIKRMTGSGWNIVLGKKAARADNCSLEDFKHNFAHGKYAEEVRLHCGPIFDWPMIG